MQPTVTGGMNAAGMQVAGASAGTVPGTAGTAGTGVPSAGTMSPPVAGMISETAGASAGDTMVVGGDGAPPAGNSADWAMMGYDLGSTYFNNAETTLTKENAGTLVVAWQADMGGNVYGAPLQVGGKIYASGPSTVRAFDAATGNQLWSVPVSSSSALAFNDGRLYSNTNTANITALNAEDGMMLWSKPYNAAAMADGSSSPLVVGDLVVIGGSNGGLELSTGAFRGFMAAINRVTGDPAWVMNTVPDTAKGASIWSSPSADLEAGRIYGSTGNNYGRPATDSSDAFISFDMATGAIQWKSQRVANDTFGGGSFAGPDADFGANPVLYQTMVGGVMTKLLSAGNKGGSAFAVRADTGALVWERDLCSGAADGSRGIFTNSTWSGKNMLFACNEGGPGTLYALDGATGAVAWMRPLPGQVWGRTAVANGVGVVGTGTALEVFDVDTGIVIKSFPSKGGTIASTVTIANGRIAFGEGLSWSSGLRGSTLTVLALP